MSVNNFTFYHKFRTGTIIKIDVIRDGKSSPIFQNSMPINDLNMFERSEYITLTDFIASTLYIDYLPEEINSLLTDTEKKMKEYEGHRWKP